MSISIKENKLEEAERNYVEALNMAKDIYGETHSINADILVKISNIQQGQRDMTEAIASLAKAMEMYKVSIEECKSVGDKEEVKRLESKLVHVMIVIADIFVDLGEMSIANETYEVRKYLKSNYLSQAYFK